MSDRKVALLEQLTLVHRCWVHSHLVGEGCVSALDTAVWECPEFGEQLAQKLILSTPALSLPPALLPVMPSNSLGSSFLFLPPQVFQQHFPKHLEQLWALQDGRCCCEETCPSLGPAQLLGNLGKLLQLSSSLGAQGSPLARWAVFPPPKPHLLWLKVDGMGMVSQEWGYSSAPSACSSLLSAGAAGGLQQHPCPKPGHDPPQTSAGTCLHLYNCDQEGTDSILTQNVFIPNKHHLEVAVSCLFLQLPQCIW